MSTRRLSWLTIVMLAITLPPAHAEPMRTPRQLIASLGIEIRQALENPKAGKTPEDAEQAVAEQISALIASSAGHLSLTEPDEHGRTPLMLAVSGGYPLVVKALLADPGVKFQVNVPDKDGETAWMKANFAPTLTLVSCQPGTLTLERSLLLPPYLRRMSAQLQTKAAGVVSIVHELEIAGAEIVPDAAKKAWLARCPNTSPELREKLAGGELLSTLINESISRQLAFNASVRDALTAVPSKPPKDMRFILLSSRDSLRPLPPLLRMGDVRCQRMPKPELLGNLNWSGEVMLKATVSTRAGIVEAVDLDLLTGGRDASPAVDYFRGLIVRALANYQCEGEFVFEQEFQFVIR